jgi:hypothetical protein
MPVLEPVMQLERDRVRVWEIVRETENVGVAAALDAPGDRETVKLCVRDTEVVGQ